MKSKTIIILAVLTILGIVLAVFVNREPTSSIPETGELVFPRLMSVINDISEMKVETNEHTITLVRGEEGWGLEEKGGYRADVEKVKSALVGLAELRLQEPKTKSPELYDRLGLQDKDQKSSTSTTLSLKSADNNQVAQVIVGNQKPAKGNPRLSEIYVRKPDDPQTWLVLGNLRLDRLPEEWLDKEITAIPSKRVRRVRVIHPDKETLNLSKEKPEDMDFKLDSVPIGFKVSSAFNLNNVVGTLVQLSLEDVRKESDVEFKPKSGVTGIVETFDGLRLRVETAKEGEKVFGKFSAEFDQTLVQKTEEKKPADPPKSKKDAGNPSAEIDKENASASEEKPSDKDADSPKKEESLLKKPEEVQQEVTAFNKRVGGWIYELPKFRVENFAKRKKDLITNKS